MKLNCWVTNAVDLFKGFTDRPINDIVIPSAHDSAFYLYNYYQNINIDTFEYDFKEGENKGCDKDCMIGFHSMKIN